MTVLRRYKRETHRCSYCEQQAVVMLSYTERRPYQCGRRHSGGPVRTIRYACLVHMLDERFVQEQRMSCAVVKRLEDL